MARTPSSMECGVSVPVANGAMMLASLVGVVSNVQFEISLLERSVSYEDKNRVKELGTKGESDKSADEAIEPR